MRPTAILVTLGVHLLAFAGATVSKSTPLSSSTSPAPSLSQSSESSSYAELSSDHSNNGYDAVLCGQNAWSDGSGYSYSSDAWNSDGSGFQCLSVINASSSTASGFDATWHWPGDPDAVHSFPHVTLSTPSTLDPAVALSNLSSLRLAAGWAMSAGTKSTAHSPSARGRTGLDVGGLRGVGTKANVAYDMFLDADPARAASATTARYEVMVWIGQVGDPYPLGFDADNATCYTQQLGALNFTLYTGQNSRGTSVFTWVSPSDETSFDEDVSPLLQYLASNGLVSADARLGLIEFGSETYHSTGNVTFSAGDFTMGLWAGVPPRFDFNPIGEKCAEPQSPSSTGTPKKGAAARTTMGGGGGGFGGAFVAALATTLVLSQGGGGSSLCFFV